MDETGWNCCMTILEYYFKVDIRNESMLDTEIIKMQKLQISLVISHHTTELKTFLITYVLYYDILIM